MILEITTMILMLVGGAISIAWKISAIEHEMKAIQRIENHEMKNKIVELIIAVACLEQGAAHMKHRIMEMEKIVYPLKTLPETQEDYERSIDKRI